MSEGDLCLWLDGPSPATVWTIAALKSDGSEMRALLADSSDLSVMADAPASALTPAP